MITTGLPAVYELIHAHMDELSEAERRVARSLLTDYPASGLGTSHSLAAAAGVSAPTVVRFATRLGFEGFSDLQQHLRAEISGSASSPVQRTLAQGIAAGTHTTFSAAMQHRMDAIATTMRMAPAVEVAAAARLIAGTTKQVLVAGGFFSMSIARILAVQLSQIRRDVVFVEEPLRRDVGLVLDARRGSVLVVFDLRRYEPSALELARQAKDSGLDIVLLTDRWMSPVAAVADTVLPVDVEAVPFDTFVALLAVVETVVESVLEETGARGLKRMDRWESHAVGHEAVGHDAVDRAKH